MKFSIRHCLLLLLCVFYHTPIDSLKAPFYGNVTELYTASTKAGLEALDVKNLVFTGVGYSLDLHRLLLITKNEIFSTKTDLTDPKLLAGRKRFSFVIILCVFISVVIFFLSR